MDGKPAKPNFDNGGIPNFSAAELRRLVEHRGGVSDARTAPPRLSPSFSFRMEDLPEEIQQDQPIKISLLAPSPSNRGRKCGSRGRPGNAKHFCG